MVVMETTALVTDGLVVCLETPLEPADTKEIEKILLISLSKPFFQ